MRVAAIWLGALLVACGSSRGGAGGGDDSAAGPDAPAADVASRPDLTIPEDAPVMAEVRASAEVGPVDSPRPDAASEQDASGPPDSSPPRPDTGASPAQFTESCAAFQACGGDVQGAWRFSELCAPRRALFRRVYSVCNTAVVTLAGAPSFAGTLTIEGQSYRQSSSLRADAQVVLPNNCSFCRCTDKETQLRGTGLDASCSPVCSGGNCNCTVVVRETVEQSGAFTAGADGLRLGSRGPFPFCRMPTSLRLQQPDPLVGDTTYTLVPAL